MGNKIEAKECPECKKLTLMLKVDGYSVEWHPIPDMFYCMLCGKTYVEESKTILREYSTDKTADDIS